MKRRCARDPPQHEQMLERFSGEKGRRLLVEAFARQRLVAGNGQLAEELADKVEVTSTPRGQVLIAQGGEDNNIFFILSGTFDISINGRRVAARGTDEHVGEMAAVEPSQKVRHSRRGSRRHCGQPFGRNVLRSRFDIPPSCIVRSHRNSRGACFNAILWLAPIDQGSGCSSFRPQKLYT